MVGSSEVIDWEGTSSEVIDWESTSSEVILFTSFSKVCTDCKGLKLVMSSLFDVISLVEEDGISTCSSFDTYWFGVHQEMISDTLQTTGSI